MQKDLKAVKSGDIKSHDIYQGRENPGSVINNHFCKYLIDN
jgi:hypothetical protein